MGLIGYQRALEAEETPALHSLELLRSEIEREERRLERRREVLAQLEAESDGESSPRKKVRSRLTPFYTTILTPTSDTSSTREIG
jgi:hypothetical protein